LNYIPHILLTDLYEGYSAYLPKVYAMTVDSIHVTSISPRFSDFEVTATSPHQHSSNHLLFAPQER